MGLNNIQLNTLLLTDMYRNSLVDIKEIPEDREKIFADSLLGNTGVKKKDPLIRNQVLPDSPDNLRDREGWNYLGEYKKNILLIVRYMATTHLPDGQLNFLTSVLGACKLNLGDIAIFNITNAPSALYKDIQNKFKSTVIILFGLTPEELEMPVDFPEFQVQAFNNCTFLHTPTLEKLEADKILKSKLWVCLRKMFGV